MVNTKKTPVKFRFRCPICGLGYHDEAAWTDHLVDCGKRKMSTQTHICQERGCTYATSKKSDLTRHLKRKHGGEDDTSCSEWERQDPGELHQYVGAAAKPREAKESLQLGRTVRKPTSPDPVKAPIKKLRVHIPAALGKASCVSATELSPLRFARAVDYGNIHLIL